MRSIIYIVTVFLLIHSSAWALLPENAKIRLADPCYLDMAILRNMFRSGTIPRDCHPKVIHRHTRKEMDGVVIDADDLRKHLIGILVNRAKVARGEAQINAALRFFAITRIPEISRRGWAISLFSREVSPTLEPDTLRALNENLGRYWASAIGKNDREGLEVLIAPTLLAMTPEGAAKRLGDLRALADKWGEEPPLGRSDIEYRGLQAISHEWQKEKRNDPKVQAVLIAYLEDGNPQLREEAAKALTNRVSAKKNIYKSRDEAAGLTRENVAKVAGLLGSSRPEVVSTALYVLSWQFAQRWVVPQRAGEELELHQKIAELLESQEERVRLAASNAYVVMHPGQSVSQLALIKALRSEDATLKENAIQALEIRSTYHIKRISDPVVLAAVVDLALSRDEFQHSQGAALLRQNYPVDLETIARLVENYESFSEAVQPVVLDVLRNAAKRKTGIQMYQDNPGEESRLRAALVQKLGSGPLSQQTELKGLLVKKNITVEQVFTMLSSAVPAEVEEAGEILSKTRPALIRPLIHNHVDAPARLSLVAHIISETDRGELGANLLEIFAQEEMIATIGRNGELFRAVLEPSPACLVNERALAAQINILRQIAAKPSRISSSVRGDAEVIAGLNRVLATDPAPAKTLELVRIYDRVQTERVAGQSVLLRELSRHVHDPDYLEVRRVIVQALRSRVPLTEMNHHAGVLGMVFANEPVAESATRQAIVEILVASYASMLPEVNEPQLLFPSLEQMIFESAGYAGAPELLEEAITQLNQALREHLEPGTIASDSALVTCAKEINKRKKK